MPRIEFAISLTSPSKGLPLHTQSPAHDAFAHAPSANAMNLREAHAHIGMHGESLCTPSVATCTSIEQVLQVVQQAARDAAQHKRTWVVVRSLRTEALQERRWPTRDELHSVCSELPLMLLSFDHHACCANDKARSLARLTDDVANPAGGVIVRDSQGKPTGVLLEKACAMVREAVPLASEADLREQLRASLCSLAAHGFVEVHDLMSPAWMGPLLARMHDAGELEVPGVNGRTVSMKIGLFPLVFEPLSQPGAGLASQARSAIGAQGWKRPGRVELLGGKVFVDGTLNARTAWMLEPFAEPLADHPRGTPLLSREQISHAIAQCASLGVGFAAHAIGDGAVRAVLDAAQQHPRAQEANCPIRIEHLEIVHEQDIPRFAQLGVIASVQPCHLLYDIEVLERQLPHTLGQGPSRVMPLRDLVVSGLKPGKTLLFGSDAPIVRPDPLDSILAATQRGRVLASAVHGPKSNLLLPNQALDAATAWACFA